MADKQLDLELKSTISECKMKKEDDYLIDQHTDAIRKLTDVIILDVGGTKFYVNKSIFATWPTTR